MIKKRRNGFFIIFIAVLIFQCSYINNNAKSESCAEQQPLMDRFAYRPQGNKILALYKSSDQQSDKENEIFYYLSLILKKMGLKIIYHDIDRSIPSEKITSDVRAVISWFRDSSMSNPEKYLDFIDSMINSERKFIVIDNLGAYQYRNPSDKEFVDPGRINVTLSKLGLWYMGDWTNDTNLLELKDINPEMVEKGDQQTIEQGSYFFRFLKVDNDLDIYLSLQRKDKKYEPSPIIVTNKNGGFIFSHFIYREQEGNITLLINFEKFLTNAIFPEQNKNLIALFYDRNDQACKNITEYTSNLLYTGRIPFTTINKNSFSALVKGDFRQFKTIGMVLRGDENLKPDWLADYLNQGGNIISLISARYYLLADQLAMNKNKQILSGGENGYSLNNELMLTEAEVNRTDFSWQPGVYQPNSTAKILGTSGSSRTPLVWSAKYGPGNILVWNWDGFANGELTGMILDSFLSVEQIGIAQVLGIGHLFLLNWPRPMYDLVSEPLLITDTDFYTKIWWPDLLANLNNINIPFSSNLLFNNNNQNKRPIMGGEFYLSKNQESAKTAANMLIENMDIGLSGFNSVPLTTSKKHNLHWENINDLKASLDEAKNSWQRIFGEGNQPFCYTAINGIIDNNGEKALLQTFPSIKIISPVTWLPGLDIENSFTPHPLNPDIFYFSRLTSGYAFQSTDWMRIYSGVTGFGVISHYIYPDDIFDKNRSSSKQWNDMNYSLIQMLKNMKNQYPWIEWLNINDVYLKLVNHYSHPFTAEINKNTVSISTMPGSLIRLRMNGNEIESMSGGIIRQSLNNNLHYIIKANEKQVFIHLKNL